MTATNTTDDGTDAEQINTDIIDGVQSNGYDHVAAERLDGGKYEDYIVVTFAPEIDSERGINKDRTDIAPGEPGAAISKQLDSDDFDVFVGYGTDVGYEVTEYYDTVDTLSKAVQSAEYWFEHEA